MSSVQRIYKTDFFYLIFIKEVVAPSPSPSFGLSVG